MHFHVFRMIIFSLLVAVHEHVKIVINLLFFQLSNEKRTAKCPVNYVFGADKLEKFLPCLPTALVACTTT